jgi:hypothetical protein
MIDWVSLGAGLLLGLIALAALILSVLGLLVLGRGVL